MFGPFHLLFPNFGKELLNVHFKKLKQKTIFIGYYLVKQGQSIPLRAGAF